MGTKKKSWADSDSDDEYPILFKIEDYNSNTNGKNIENKNEKKKNGDISIPTRYDTSSNGSNNSKEKPINIPSRTE